MANALYPKWKEALMADSANAPLTGSGTSGLFCALVDTGVYTYNPAHQFYSPSLTGITGTDQEITAVTTALGVVDGNNVTFTAVAAGPNLEALVLYRKNTGANTTWLLVAYLDTLVTGLPVTPNGGDITVTWSASGIFAL